LARYEHRTEHISGNGTVVGAISSSAFGGNANGVPGDYDTHIVSMNVNVNPDRDDQIMGRLAGKISSQDDGILKSTYAAELLQTRWIHQLNDQWDIGLQETLLHGTGGAWQKSAGFEVGKVLMKDLWFSLGYNFTGVSDKDLTADAYTNKGLYARLRFKFDETSLGFDSVGDAVTPKEAAPKPVSVQTVTASVITAASLFETGMDHLTEPGKAQLNALSRRLAQTSEPVRIAMPSWAQRTIVLRSGDSAPVRMAMPSPANSAAIDTNSLEMKRARAIEDYLLQQGLAADRIALVDVMAGDQAAEAEPVTLEVQDR
jgi:hypothetical protein